MSSTSSITSCTQLEFHVPDTNESGSPSTSATGFVPLRKDPSLTEPGPSATEFALAVYRGLKQVAETVTERQSKHGAVWDESQMGHGCLAMLLEKEQFRVLPSVERLMACCAMIDHKEQRWLNDIYDLDSLLDGIAYRAALWSWLTQV
jgi:hypothetical protein